MSLARVAPCHSRRDRHSREHLLVHNVLSQESAVDSFDREAQVVKMTDAGCGDIELAMRKALVAKKDADALERLPLGLIDGHGEGWRAHS